MSYPIMRRVAPFIVAIGLVACGTEEVVEVDEAARPAKLIEVATSADVQMRSFPAIVEASSSVDLTFQVSGRIEDVAVSAGDEVKKGQVIARLAQRDFRNNLATMQAQFDAAQAEYARAERLFQQDAIAQNVVEQRQSQRDVAQASLDSAQKSFEDTVLRSPFEGVVAVVHAVDFQNIGAQVEVVTLQTTGTAEAVVQIPATLVANSGRIEAVENVLILDAAPNQPLPAELYSAATQADTQTQTFEVRFAFTPPDNLLILPGMTGTLEASLILSGDDGATERITVPLSSITSEGDKAYVWVVNEADMTVSRREIAIASDIGEQLAVESGLEPGDIIVGAGAAFLHEGMQVRRYEQ